MKQVMHVTFVASSMGMGGAERVISIIGNHWAAAGHDVTIITLASMEADFFTLVPSVHRLALDLLLDSTSIPRAFWNNWRRLRAIRQAIQTSQPDVVISFIHQTNILTLLATLGMRLPVVVSERVDPCNRPGWVWDWSRRLLYPKARALVIQTEAVYAWATKLVRPENIAIIPNPIILPQANAVETVPREPLIVAMGRLVHQKGFDLLLRAFAQCAPEQPDWRIVIVGDGPERNKLLTLAHELKIEHRVQFPGSVKEPYSILSRASIFVLSSRFEGFPNALLEAMACGLPAISFDCPSGPSVIIRHEMDGMLVPPEDVDALASAMSRLMSDRDEQQRLALRAPEVLERFGLERIIGQWEELLHDIFFRKAELSTDAQSTFQNRICRLLM